MVTGFLVSFEEGVGEEVDVEVAGEEVEVEAPGRAFAPSVGFCNGVASLDLGVQSILLNFIFSSFSAGSLIAWSCLESLGLFS